MSAQVGLPVSSLLPPGDLDYRPTATLSSPAAILGPLPPTSPLSFAASFLQLSDLQPFEPSTTPAQTTPPDPPSPSKPADPANPSAPLAPLDPPAPLAAAPPALFGPSPARVLIITASRPLWHALLEESDPEWLRNPSPELQATLKRIDIRYAPSAAHVKLLLTLLTSSPGEQSAHHVPVPSMIVLWDVGGMLLRRRDGDVPSREGKGEGDDQTSGQKAEPGFEPNTTISTYLDLVAAALDAARHLGGVSPLPLVILEPGFTADTTLPILPPGNNTSVPVGSRNTRVSIKAGLERLLGSGSVGAVTAEGEGGQEHPHLLEIAGERYTMKKTPGTRAEFADPPNAGTEGGWVWNWTL